MKELTIEQKAKRYDEAIEKAKSKIKNDKDHVLYEDDILDIFPKLKESEDDSIRKRIIALVNAHGQGMYKDEMLAWLERQGEQKLTDKVEPKFKVGDFIVNDYCMGRIVEITNDAYLLDTGQGIPFSCEHNAHLWTIRDAKDGDVIASNNSIFIFQEEYIAEKPIAYCGIMNGCFIKGQGACWTNEKCYPATKEQRDTLIKAMTEAGYTFDFEKKELKKIEPKIAAWTPMDEQRVENLLSIIEGHGYPGEVAWLNSLKDRVQPKQEWSEEDMKMIRTLVAIFEVNYPDGFYKVNPIGTTNMQGIHSSEIIKWLKSLYDICKRNNYGNYKAVVTP